MRNEKIISFEEYISKKNRIEKERKELIHLIRAVIATMKKENKNIL